MFQLDTTAAHRPAPVSPLVLSDRLIALAQAADRAGFTDTADKLVHLACSVLDEAPHPGH
jgi:hypothetical protein